jgi:hypothetical protein
MPPMDWQQAASLALVALVVAVSLGFRWRRKASGCSGGCCTPTPLKPGTRHPAASPPGNFKSGA